MLHEGYFFCFAIYIGKLVKPLLFVFSLFLFFLWVKNWVGKTGKTFETIDPRTGEVIARISEGTKEDIDIAVKAARQAFDSGPWPRMPGAVR